MKHKANKHQIIVLLWIIIVLLPILPLLLWSFSSSLQWPVIFPKIISLRAWEYVFVINSNTFIALRNSMLIAIMVTMIDLILVLPSAYIMTRKPIKFKKAFEILFMAPIFIPPFISLMGSYTTFIRLGLTESVTGIVLAHIVPTFPYMYRTLKVSFTTFSSKWEDQATMLGADKLKTSRYIILPYLIPGIVAGSILTMLISLSQYLSTLLVGGGYVVTLPIIMFPFISGGDTAVGSVYTLLFSGMALFILIIFEKLLRKYYKVKMMIHI